MKNRNDNVELTGRQEGGNQVSCLAGVSPFYSLRSDSVDSTFSVNHKTSYFFNATLLLIALVVWNAIIVLGVHNNECAKGAGDNPYLCNMKHSNSNPYIIESRDIHNPGFKKTVIIGGTDFLQIPSRVPRMEYKPKEDPRKVNVVLAKGTSINSTQEPSYNPYYDSASDGDSDVIETYTKHESIITDKDIVKKMRKPNKKTKEWRKSNNHLMQ